MSDNNCEKVSLFKKRNYWRLDSLDKVEDHILSLNFLLPHLSVFVCSFHDLFLFPFLKHLFCVYCVPILGYVK